jgi:hypothetical protein
MAVPADCQPKLLGEVAVIEGSISANRGFLRRCNESMAVVLSSTLTGRPSISILWCIVVLSHLGRGLGTARQTGLTGFFRIRRIGLVQEEILKTLLNLVNFFLVWFWLRVRDWSQGGAKPYTEYMPVRPVTQVRDCSCRVKISLISA